MSKPSKCDLFAYYNPNLMLVKVTKNPDVVVGDCLLIIKLHSVIVYLERGHNLPHNTHKLAPLISLIRVLI